MEDCPICYESVNASTGHCTLACSHSFHISCLTRWSATNTTCPMCRNAMGATEAPASSPPAVAVNTTYRNSHLRVLIEGSTPPLFPLDETLPNPLVNIRDDTGYELYVEERDITLVMSQAEVDRGEAVRALRRYEGDVVNAMLMLTAPPLPLTVTRRRRPIRIRDPMTEPSDDQVTAWSLQRLFGDESTHYNTHSDLLGRMNYTLRRNKFWQHEEHNDIDDHPGYESA
jgi:hypothetical protein